MSFCVISGIKKLIGWLYKKAKYMDVAHMKIKMTKLICKDEKMRDSLSWTLKTKSLEARRYYVHSR